MKPMLPFAATLVVILNALILVPALAGQQAVIATTALLVAILTAVIAWLPSSSKSNATAQPEPATPAMPPTPEPAAERASGPAAGTEAVTLLAAFQERGRLVDFLMEDVAPYDDTQIGASARVVHQGCRAVLNDYFEVHPVSSAGEGSKVTVPAGYAASEYKLVGKVSGDPPYKGSLVHQGWKTDQVKLPKQLENAQDRLPAIAPAEVEVGG